MSTEYSVKAKVVFTAGFGDKDGAWEDRLKEAHEVRELFHTIFEPYVGSGEFAEIEMDEEKRAPIEYEIDGRPACCFGMELEMQDSAWFTELLFGALKSFPTDITPLKAMNWKEQSWAEDFCRQRGCWLDLEYYEGEEFLFRYVWTPAGEEFVETNERSDRSTDDYVSDTRAETAIKLAAAGY